MDKKMKQHQKIPHDGVFGLRHKRIASFQVMAVKRGHSVPPISANTALVNLPSAVRRAASDRDEETSGLGFD
jgi:hypothetical protein